MTTILECPVVLYRLFGQSGELLYVGITGNPKGRLAVHAAEKPWWKEVDLARTRFETLNSRTEAERAEVGAIRAENPKYNIADHPGKRAEMAARAREVALASMAARRGEDRESLADIDDIEQITDPAERARQAGQRLSAIPSWQERLRKIRQAAVVEMKAKGMSYADIGRELDLHRNRAQQIFEGRSAGGKGSKPE